MTCVVDRSDPFLGVAGQRGGAEEKTHAVGGGSGCRPKTLDLLIGRNIITDTRCCRLGPVFFRPFDRMNAGFVQVGRSGRQVPINWVPPAEAVAGCGECLHRTDCCPRSSRSLSRRFEEQDNIMPAAFDVVVVDNDAAASARDVVQAALGARSALRPPRRRAAEEHRPHRDRTVAMATGDRIASIDDDEPPSRPWLRRMLETVTPHQAQGAMVLVRLSVPLSAPEWIRRDFDERGAFPDLHLIDAPEPVWDEHRALRGRSGFAGWTARSNPPHGLTGGFDGVLFSWLAVWRRSVRVVRRGGGRGGGRRKAPDAALGLVDATLRCWPDFARLTGHLVLRPVRPWTVPLLAGRASGPTGSRRRSLDCLAAPSADGARPIGSSWSSAMPASWRGWWACATANTLFRLSGGRAWSLSRRMTVRASRLDAYGVLSIMFPRRGVRLLGQTVHRLQAAGPHPPGRAGSPTGRHEAESDADAEEP